MNISSIDRRAITKQDVRGGLLVTDFTQSKFHDGTEMHPAGRLICEPWTPEDQRRFDEQTQGAADEFGGSLGHTVTRFGVVFHDAGEYIADPITQRLARIAEDLESKRSELTDIYNEIRTPNHRPNHKRGRIVSVGAAVDRIYDAIDELKDAQELTT